MDIPGTMGLSQGHDLPKIHRQHFSIPQLTTTSVTIYPTRAAIVRNIKGVVLKPGRNEVSLHQLTPVAEQDSIKVSGRLIDHTGHSNVLLLADMTVDLMKPSANIVDEKSTTTSASEDSDNDCSSDSDITISETESPTLVELNKQVRELKSQIKDHKDETDSIDKRLDHLSKWGQILTSPPTVEADRIDRTLGTVIEYMSKYEEVRKKLFERCDECHSEIIVLEKKLKKAEKKASKLSNKLLAGKRKANEKKQMAKEEDRIRRLEEGKEDKMTKSQGPEKWYRVRVWIERQEDDDIVEGELQISYLVSQTGWSPRYDIVIDSTSTEAPNLNRPKATLTYHAHFYNRTWETWKEAMITLSTSQTAFTGLNDKIPSLDSWRVGLTSYLVRIHGSNANTTEAVKERSQAALYTSQERSFAEDLKGSKETAEMDKGASRKSRTREESRCRSRSNLKKKIPKGEANFSAISSFGDSLSYRAPTLPAASRGASFKRSSANSSSGVEAFASYSKTGNRRRREEEEGEEEEEEEDVEGDSMMDEDKDESSESDAEIDSIADTLNAGPGQAKPAAPKPNFVNQGLTSSYAIPLPMTIPSAPYPPPPPGTDNGSSAVRRHTILTVTLGNIAMSYASTPKYRAAAYLKARILNSSKTTFRKGPIGITLDGTYVGTTTFSKTIYPGAFFTLNLGIDESVTVNYAKPTVKRSIQKARGGILNKVSWSGGLQDMVAVYNRSTVIRNNRLDRGPIELVVTDQVPVSEDAKLIINILLPRGLKPPTSDEGLSRRIPEDHEIVEEDENGVAGQGSSMKTGPPVRAGTGVYIEGMEVVIEEDQPTATDIVPLAQPSAQPPRKYQPIQPAQPYVERDEDSDASNNDSTKTSKRRSSFFSSLKFSQGTKTESSSYSPPSTKIPRQPPINRDVPVVSPYTSQNSSVERKRPEEKWGSAVAVMRKTGEVVWKVKLNPGMGVRLGLDYECRVPAGESIRGL